MIVTMLVILLVFFALCITVFLVMPILFATAVPVIFVRERNLVEPCKDLGAAWIGLFLSIFLMPVLAKRLYQAHQKTEKLFLSNNE